MFAKARLRELDDTKRLVVLQSDIHRGLLQLESAAVRERLAGFLSARQKLAARGPLLIAGAAVAGVLAVRHWRTLARWAPSVLAAWRWWRALRGGN
jgi:hypothetical protein